MSDEPLPLAECLDGRLYLVRARNFRVGLFRARRSSLT